MKEWTKCCGDEHFKTYFHPDGSSTTIGENYYKITFNSGITSITMQIYPV